MSSSGTGRALGLGCVARGDDEAVDLPRDVPFEAADDLSARLSLGKAAPHVLLGAAVPAQSAEDNPVEGSVGLSITTSVQPPTLGLAGGCLNRTGATQGSKG